MSDDAYDIAGICAHPDDAELVMGGTLARAAAEGRRIALVDLTHGECGSRLSRLAKGYRAAGPALVLSR